MMNSTPMIAARHADRADRPHAHHRHRRIGLLRLDHQALDDEIRAGADQRAGAAEHGRIAERNEQLRRAEAGAFWHQSLTTGMNIATTGVLFRNALNAAPAPSCGSARRPWTAAARAAARSTSDIAPVSVRPAATTNSTATVSSPSLPKAAAASRGDGNLGETRLIVMSSVTAPMRRTSVDATFSRQRVEKQHDDDEREERFPAHKKVVPLRTPDAASAMRSASPTRCLGKVRRGGTDLN